MPTHKDERLGETPAFHIYSSIAQSVEPAAVNRVVVGSSPTWGAKKRSTSSEVLLFFVSETEFQSTTPMATAARLLTATLASAACGGYSGCVFDSGSMT